MTAGGDPPFVLPVCGDGTHGELNISVNTRKAASRTPPPHADALEHSQNRGMVSQLQPHNFKPAWSGGWCATVTPRSGVGPGEGNVHCSRTCRAAARHGARVPNPDSCGAESDPKPVKHSRSPVDPEADLAPRPRCQFDAELVGGVCGKLGSLKRLGGPCRKAPARSV